MVLKDIKVGRLIKREDMIYLPVIFELFAALQNLFGRRPASCRIICGGCGFKISTNDLQIDEDSGNWACPECGETAPDGARPPKISWYG